MTQKHTIDTRTPFGVENCQFIKALSKCCAVDFTNKEIMLHREMVEHLIIKQFDNCVILMEESPLARRLQHIIMEETNSMNQSTIVQVNILPRQEIRSLDERMEEARRGKGTQKKLFGLSELAEFIADHSVDKSNAARRVSSESNSKNVLLPYPAYNEKVYDVLFGNWADCDVHYTVPNIAFFQVLKKHSDQRWLAGKNVPLFTLVDCTVVPLSNPIAKEEEKVAVNKEGSTEHYQAGETMNDVFMDTSGWINLIRELHLLREAVNEKLVNDRKDECSNLTFSDFYRLVDEKTLKEFKNFDKNFFVPNVPFFENFKCISDRMRCNGQQVAVFTLTADGKNSNPLTKPDPAFQKTEKETTINVAPPVNIIEPVKPTVYRTSGGHWAMHTPEMPESITNISKQNLVHLMQKLLTLKAETRDRIMKDIENEWRGWSRIDTPNL